VSAEIAATAVLIGGVDYGDADRVITLLTRERGKLAAFAAGARRSKRRFAGALEPFTLLSVRLREGRGDLLHLDSCSVLDGHGGLREDLARLAYAGHAAELCRELVRDREPHPGLFDDLVRYLGGLSRGAARPEDLLAFELGALAHGGFAPRLSECAICGEAVRGAALFDPDHGGVLCGACAGTAGRSALQADAAALDALRELAARGPLAGVDVPDAQVRARARGLLRRFTRHAIGREPRSLQFLAQLGIEG
jgi:DNA repair protein RecO (recombination protein O)